MASQNQQYFDGSTSFTDTHDNILSIAGNAVWLNEFRPRVEGSKKRIAEALLWSFNLLGLCCTLAGEFAMYIGGKLVSRRNAHSLVKYFIIISGMEKKLGILELFVYTV